LSPYYQYPYNYQYVQSKEDIHTKLPKNVESLVQKETKKKNATNAALKKGAAKKKSKKGKTNLAQMPPVYSWGSFSQPVFVPNMDQSLAQPVG
jgi:hypothetical protein